MAETRSLKLILQRERYVEHIFEKFPGKSKLIECHGGLSSRITPRYPIVPEDTVIIFLSNFGQCMSIGHGRHLANKYFRSKTGLLKFFRGEAGFARIHHGAIADRTFITGEEYPNAYLTFYDSRISDFGYVWRLPLRYKKTEQTNNLLATKSSVQGRDVYTNIPRAPDSRTTLKEVVEKLGPGVYIVNACLVPSNQSNLPIGKIPFNLPRGDSDRRAPRRTRDALAFARSIYGPKSLRKPGTPMYTPTVLKSRRPPKSRHVTVQSVLTRIGRPGVKINLPELFPQMRANVNKKRLLAVQNIIQNPNKMLSKLNATQRANWSALPWNKKGPYVSQWLERQGLRFRAENKNLKHHWFNGNTGRPINAPEPGTLNNVEWTNEIENIFKNKIKSNLRHKANWLAWRVK